MRVVLDTYVFVSSLLLKRGGPARLMDAWRDRAFLLVSSPDILAEIASTLRYPHIRDKYGVTEADVEGLIFKLEQDALVVPGLADVTSAIPDDPDDEAVLACALDGSADLIVSGDRHLLALERFEGIEIIGVRAFLERQEADH